MAAVSMAPGLPPSSLQFETSPLSTIADRRSPDEFPSPKRNNSFTSQPDLNSEMANLSDKLISAINHQTNLDEILAATRHELEITQERVRQLEIENKEHTRLLSSGALVSKADVEDQANKLVANLAEERKRRTVVEKDKKGMEQELENLTTALFEEANQMVAAARKEREVAERTTEQLQNQLNDTELLLATHQEQLAELKEVMQQMDKDFDECETVANNGSTASSTPALLFHRELGKIHDTTDSSSGFPGARYILPAPPTSFSNILSPVLRTDLQSFEDFCSLLKISRRSILASRISSGSYSGVNVLGLTNFPNWDPNSHNTHIPSNFSTSVISATPHYSPSFGANPILPASAMSNVPPPTTPLKETRFYKRALSEDIEPTLRLDTAPGLSWLARRTVINSMCEGSLVVEPMPASAKMHVFPCALCGEHRKGEAFTRTHRFRTSESENAQRYPLCHYCLNRIRTSCDYLGFLRMVRDGYWKADEMEEKKLAWEESVKLRERMFWARIGGGVIPAVMNRESPLNSAEGTNQNTLCGTPSVLKTSHEVFKETLSETTTDNHDPIHPTAEQPMAEVDIAGSEKARDLREQDRKIPQGAVSYNNMIPPTIKLAEISCSQLGTSLRESLMPRPRSRAASYERERSATPSPSLTTK